MDHVVSCSARLLHEHAGIAHPPRFADFATPLDAFRATRAAIELVLDDPAAPREAVTHLQWGIGFDLPPHGWDLAKATGQDAAIAAEDVEALGNGRSEGLRASVRLATRTRTLRIGHRRP